MKLRTEELTGEALNWAVAHFLKLSPIVAPPEYGNPARVFAMVPVAPPSAGLAAALQRTRRVARFTVEDPATAWEVLQLCVGEASALEIQKSTVDRLAYVVGFSEGKSLGEAVGRYYLWWTGTRTVDIPDELLS